MLCIVSMMVFRSTTTLVYHVLHIVRCMSMHDTSIVHALHLHCCITRIVRGRSSNAVCDRRGIVFRAVARWQRVGRDDPRGHRRTTRHASRLSLPLRTVSLV